MMSIPLPILAAALCVVIAPLMLRLDLGRRAAAVMFALLFIDFGIQSLLVGVRFGYGIEHFITFQRVLPLTVGPLLFLGFSCLTVPKDIFARQVLLHLGSAVLIAIGLSLFADIYREFDVVISVSYLLYIGLLVRLWRKGQDHLIYAKLDVSGSTSRWMLSAVALLLLLLALDTAIALSFVLFEGTQAPALVTFGSALLIGSLIFILTKMPHPTAPKTDGIAISTAPDSETSLEHSAREVLERSKLYLDPDLSVQRLARRLSVPERTLSAAINQSQGMNVSQYVNGFRLRHAADLLRTTSDPVSKVMAQSGFLTRSNFYREFQRVYGQSPAQFRKEPIRE
ncbi:MAG: AraC family transcriptional regulator [Sulfitobacter sp.]